MYNNADAQGSDSLAEEYVKLYTDQFFLWPVLKQRTLDFEVAKATRPKQFLDYKPNNAYSIGLGLYLFDLAFEITSAIPLGEENRKIYGESDVLDLQLNALSRQWGADIYYQKYQGFYIRDRTLAYNKDIPYPQRRDIIIRNIGITGLYVFDERFSIRSSYNFAERQLKSSGSFLLTTSISSFKVSADSAVLLDNYQADYGKGAGFQNLRYTTFSLAPGYSYNFIYRNFFLSAAVMLGPAYNWVRFEEQQGTSGVDNRVNRFTSVRLGAGYSADRFFAGINFVSQTRAVRFEDIYFTNSSNTFRILVGMRFNEFGILKKSVWDIPKKIMN